MADQLAKPEDLVSLLDLGDTANMARATLLVECATAVVQAATGGQRIVADTSTAVLPAPSGPYLELPQWPVRSITSVTIDGTADSSWRPDGGRVWRPTWRTRLGQPTAIAVTYEHGYTADSQGLQLARQAVLSLAAPLYDNPNARIREQVDDWAGAYEAMATRMEASRFMKEALVSQYGRTAGSVGIGG